MCLQVVKYSPKKSPKVTQKSARKDLKRENPVALNSNHPEKRKSVTLVSNLHRWPKSMFPSGSKQQRHSGKEPLPSRLVSSSLGTFAVFSKPRNFSEAARVLSSPGSNYSTKKSILGLANFFFLAVYFFFLKYG